MAFGIRKKASCFMNFTNGADSIAAATTAYVSVGGSITDSATEQARQICFGKTTKVSKLTIVTGNTQPVSGSLVLTIRKTGVATSVVLTLAAGAVAGTYSTTTTSATFSAGDLLSLQAVNNASGNSAAILAWSIKVL